MNIRQIKETCIYSTDLGAARKFYHELLGLPIIGEVKEKHIFFRVGTSVLLCFNPAESRKKKSPPAHFSKGKFHFAFEVPDGIFSLPSGYFYTCNKNFFMKPLTDFLT